MLHQGGTGSFYSRCLSISPGLMVRHVLWDAFADSTGESMILSAGIIIVRRVEEQWFYLLLRAYNNWDFPKGEVEDGETPFDSARREVKEETGLSDLSFRWGRIYKETHPYRNGRKKARYYLAATTESKISFSINPELGRPEHHEYRWLNGEMLEKLTSPRLHPVIAWARSIVEA